MEGKVCENSNPIIVKLKLSNESKEHEVSISNLATIGELKEKVKDKCGISNDKTIRLIYSGKLLDPPVLLLHQFNILNGSFVHVVLSERKIQSIVSNDIDGVGNMPPLNSRLNQESRIVPRLGLNGFDILLSTERDESCINSILQTGFGLSVNDVASIRTHFRPNVNEYIIIHHLQKSENESDLVFRMNAELLWMNTQGPDSEFSQNLPRRNPGNNINNNNSHNSRSTHIERLMNTFLPSNNPSLNGINSSEDFFNDESNIGVNPSVPISSSASGQNNDFMWGFLMGFVFGFIMIFCVWDRNVSRRQKHGILCGMTFQMIMASFQQKQPEKSKT